MMTRGSSFSQRGGGFLAKTYTHADIFFFFCDQTAASYDLAVFLPLKTSVWAFRICLHCQIQKHLENQRSIKETYYYFVPCLHLDLQNKLSGQKGHLEGTVSMESLYLLGRKCCRIGGQLGPPSGLGCGQQMHQVCCQLWENSEWKSLES